MNTRRLHTMRVVSQVGFTGLFLLLLLTSGRTDVSSWSGNFFFYTDPLLYITDILATGRVVSLLVLSLVPLVLTAFLGRFFCGWVCPFGALHQFFSFLGRRKGEAPAGGDQRLLKLKYAVLIVVLVLAALGGRFAVVADPFGLLTRSLAVPVFSPVEQLAGSSRSVAPVPAPASEVALKAEKLSDFPRLETPNPVHTQVWAIGLVLLVLVALNFAGRRYFCNYLCPLGALYAVVARGRRVRIAKGSACRECGSCVRTCSRGGGPVDVSAAAECYLCLNCGVSCSDGSVEFTGTASGGARIEPLDIGRRRVLGAVAVGLFLGALPSVSAAANERKRGMLRPPGAAAEEQFLERCLRCSACLQVCPTNYIQLAGLEAGVENLWTPMLRAQTGYCLYDCNRCTQVCPSDALRPLSVPEKKTFRIGTAVVDRNRCYPHADGFNCTVCQQHCPVPGNAIVLRPAEVIDYRGNPAVVNLILVNADRCIGCGICEYVCPREDAPGIFVTCDEEDRESGF